MDGLRCDSNLEVTEKTKEKAAYVKAEISTLFCTKPTHNPVLLLKFKNTFSATVQKDMVYSDEMTSGRTAIITHQCSYGCWSFLRQYIGGKNTSMSIFADSRTFQGWGAALRHIDPIVNSKKYTTGNKSLIIPLKYHCSSLNISDMTWIAELYHFGNVQYGRFISCQANKADMN